jgi:CRP-like cAMP-binding protein
MAYARGEASVRQATVETSTDALIVELGSSAIDGLSPGCQLQLNRALLRTLADRLEFANARLSAGGA